MANDEVITFTPKDEEGQAFTIIKEQEVSKSPYAVFTVEKDGSCHTEIYCQTLARALQEAGFRMETQYPKDYIIEG